MKTIGQRKRWSAPLIVGAVSATIISGFAGAAERKVLIENFTMLG